MRNKTVCFVPLISVSFSEDWESDDDSSLDVTRSEMQECGVEHHTLSMKAHHDPSPESIEEKKIFLKKETSKKRLCRSCKLNKTKEHFVSTDTIDKDKIQSKNLENGKFNIEKTTLKEDYLQTSDLTCTTGDESNEAKQSDDMKTMKPVPASVRKHIYKGISHDGNGRSKYLQMRYHTAPEERWYHPITSSMQYGWTWGYPPEIKCPEHGRKMTIYHSFFRPNDVNLKSRN
ncbi:hypothetical protein AVEN_203646-1 [Araneus ventricosus]|uniref:Sperm microtubule inner protein 1 C-terminal domain-containing protein n=1 Tax=Araneus ventricosus TaxID=182803 RepID=A0A4Y2JAG6_ARAVE|nr:hypothetical protein AVEN_203646-1 [Araneus ventricosus]